MPIKDSVYDTTVKALDPRIRFFCAVTNSVADCVPSGAFVVMRK